MSTKISDMPPYAITIQQAGYSQRDLPTESEEVESIKPNDKNQDMPDNRERKRTNKIDTGVSRT